MQRYLVKENDELKHILFGTKSSKVIINAKKNKAEIIKVQEFSEEELQFWFNNSKAKETKMAQDCEPFINELSYAELDKFINITGISRDAFLVRHIAGMQCNEIFKNSSKHLAFTEYNDYFNRYYLFIDGKSLEERDQFNIFDHI